MSIEELKDKIITACDWAIAQGYTIQHDDWGIDRDYETGKWVIDPVHTPRHVCPMAACVLKSEVEPTLSGWPGASAMAALGVSKEWVEGFTWGFDMDDAPYIGPEKEAYQLGKELRKKYIPASASS